MQLLSFLAQFLLPTALVLFFVWRFAITPAVRKAQHRIRNEEESARVREKLEAAFAKDEPAERNQEAEVDAAIDELRRSTKEDN